MLPADSVEMKRLNTQHRTLRTGLGGLYPENYAESITRRLAPQQGETVRICDLGSGSAEMATAFPHSEVLAIDLAPGVPVFKVADVTREVPEYYNQFDLIQGRCIANGIKNYKGLFTSIHHYLKPGGILISAEGRITKAILNHIDSTAHDLGYFEVLGEDLKPMEPKESGGLAKLLFEAGKRQIPPNDSSVGVENVADYLEVWIKGHGGFEEIKEHNIYIPVGWEGSTELCKEPHLAGQLMLQNTRVGLHVYTRVSAVTNHGHQSELYWRLEADVPVHGTA
ncbi:putative methyltransferase domain-containing protein [Rhizoctonia solani AG-1 IA]|uniref:Putative methyltransferase domain-containing protein n=1 Tax=Thanatephorus cucumeris (strain AG1-IA) TaxID=983506 RepID=L8WRB4_THACA|nr:putative methyltransferase domain-containing protein [Rhizoctonia solani AG-1 IA]